MRANVAQDITRFFITDDNFARNSDWEILLDRVIKLQDCLLYTSDIDQGLRSSVLAAGEDARDKTHE